MSGSVVRALVAALCLVSLSACETLKDKITAIGSAPADTQVSTDSEATGSIAQAQSETAPSGRIAIDQSYLTGAPLGADPNDDLELGKRHFRRAVEKSSGNAARDAEAWIGLAASYDRLRRFELADRAYANAIKIAGANAAILNNQGYSYILRGDYRKARAKLAAARAQDPDNPYIRNNIELLERSVRAR